MMFNSKQRYTRGVAYLGFNRKNLLNRSTPRLRAKSQIMNWPIQSPVLLYTVWPSSSGTSITITPSSSQPSGSCTRPFWSIIELMPVLALRTIHLPFSIARNPENRMCWIWPWVSPHQPSLVMTASRFAPCFA